MSLLSLHALEHLIHHYGYAAIFLCLMLESIGVPLPGESLMIVAALYAAKTHSLNIFIVVPVAAAGAIGGDQIGYLIGRSIGFRILNRWGGKAGLTEDRLGLGRFLFRKYGPNIVFLGRFIAILRTATALLAGANAMPWRTFLVWNALGGACWTALYGFGAYALGDAAKRLSGPVGIAFGAIGGIAILAAAIFVNRNQKRLLDEARREMKRTG